MRHTFEVLPGVLVRVRAVVPAVHFVATQLNTRNVLDLGDLLTLALECGRRWVKAGVVVLDMYFLEPAFVRGLAATPWGFFIIIKGSYSGSRDPLIETPVV